MRLSTESGKMKGPSLG